MTDTTSAASAIFGTDNFFQRDNYAPVADELTEFDLPVEGAIPAELDGWYLRNGPNPRVAKGHWFTGDGMIHGIRIEGGRAAWYRNRWVRTESFEKSFPIYNADGTRNLHASVANTHVVNHAGKTLALVETSLPYEISNDLETLGAYDFGGKLVDSMTAHPKICPTTGELHFFGYGNIFAPHVTYHRADANGELTVNRPLDVPALTMMHDFALTAEHVIFMDLPIVFNLELAMTPGRDMPYRWDDNYGARLGVLRRDDPFGEVRWFEIDPCYVFHVANAYDSGNSIVLQAVRYPDLWRGTSGFETDGVLWSWTIDLQTGTRDRTSARRSRHRVSAHRRSAGRTARPLRRLRRCERAGALRPEHRQRRRAQLRHGGVVGPPGRGRVRTVDDPARPTKDNGWYLGYVYDPARDGSDLVDHRRVRLRG